MRSRWGRRIRTSVGRRIAILVAAEAVTMGLLVAYLIHALTNIARDLEYSTRFIVAPTEALQAAINEATALEVELRRDATHGVALLSHVREVERIVARYRSEWGANAPSADAKRFRGELMNAGRLSLINDELHAVAQIEERTLRLRDELRRASGGVPPAALDDAERLKQALRALLKANVDALVIHQAIQVERYRDMRTTLLGLGLAGLVVTTLLGLHVRNAIAPRLAALVRKIRGFQETGTLERSPDPAHDEIALLANALDAGLHAIHERDRERERFLSIAAHELKTPLMSIVGYAQAALELKDPKTRTHALEVVTRQARRLGRLTQDLLWAASARQGHLAFHPSPLELSALVKKTTSELDDGIDRFRVEHAGDVHILADADLLSHALWQVLSYAVAIAGSASVLEVQVRRTDGRVAVEVEVPEVVIPLDELERAFSPFEVVQYEHGHTRYAVGLYLSREIVRLHGGALRATESEEHRATLRLELPA